MSISTARRIYTVLRTSYVVLLLRLQVPTVFMPALGLARVVTMLARLCTLM